MANTLTAKLTITDANGVIAGATPTAGINFSFDYTKALRQEFSLAASGTKTITLDAAPKCVVIVPLSGEYTVAPGQSGTPAEALIKMIAADGGAVMIGSPITGGVATDVYHFIETSGVNTASAVIYYWA